MKQLSELGQLKVVKQESSCLQDNFSNAWSGFNMVSITLTYP